MIGARVIPAHLAGEGATVADEREQGAISDGLDIVEHDRARARRLVVDSRRLIGLLVAQWVLQGEAKLAPLESALVIGHRHFTVDEARQMVCRSKERT